MSADRQPRARPDPTDSVAAPEPRFALALLGRSLFPIVALVLILGTLLWGPWITLILTFGWWQIVTRTA